MSSKDHKAEKSLKISSIGEKQLIKRLLSQSRSLQPNSSFFDESSFKSLSDDSALIDLGDKYLVVTSDLLLESTHFPSDMSPYEKGAKVVTVNVSDLAAMGAQPLGFVLSWGLPRIFPLLTLTIYWKVCSNHARDMEWDSLGATPINLMN